MLFAEGMKHAAASKVPTGRRRMMIIGTDWTSLVREARFLKSRH